MTLTLDDACCTHCRHNRGFMVHSSVFVVDCEAYGPTSLMAVCNRYKEKPLECEKCSPINIGWCTGDCKKCPSRTEWQEWAE